MKRLVLLPFFKTDPSSSYMLQKEDYMYDDDDDDFWDWVRRTDSSILSLKVHRFVTWNKRKTVGFILSFDCDKYISDPFIGCPSRRELSFKLYSSTFPRFNDEQITWPWESHGYYAIRDDSQSQSPERTRSGHVAHCKRQAKNFERNSRAAAGVWRPIFAAHVYWRGAVLLSSKL